jgi:isoquinoline 1-oxidoreductase subunit alpha
MAKIHLRVNGQAREVDADPEMPLLWLLRDSLGLTGTKFGCGIGVCGACTVHLGGEAVRSCLVPAKSAAGKEVRTIEGLSPDGSHPLQRAWVEEDVPQCGYCQAGQIMNAAALLVRLPGPVRPLTDAEVDRAMSGNLCRCGTYPRIRRAIHRAVEIAREKS